MDEGATCFCARREFACSYVLQAFDDCLELVHFEGRGYSLSRPVVANDQSEWRNKPRLSMWHMATLYSMA